MSSPPPPGWEVVEDIHNLSFLEAEEFKIIPYQTESGKIYLKKPKDAIDDEDEIFLEKNERTSRRGRGRGRPVGKRGKRGKAGRPGLRSTPVDLSDDSDGIPEEVPQSSVESSVEVPVAAPVEVPVAAPTESFHGMETDDEDEYIQQAKNIKISKSDSFIFFEIDNKSLMIQKITKKEIENIKIDGV
jgi:hypothetical protein